MPPPEKLFWKKQHGNNTPSPDGAAEQHLRGISCCMGFPGVDFLSGSSGGGPPTAGHFPAPRAPRGKAAPLRGAGGSGKPEGGSEVANPPASSRQSWQGSQPWKTATSDVPVISQPAAEQGRSSQAQERVQHTEGEAHGPCSGTSLTFLSKF